MEDRRVPWFLSTKLYSNRANVFHEFTLSKANSEDTKEEILPMKIASFVTWPRALQTDEITKAFNQGTLSNQTFPLAMLLELNITFVSRIYFIAPVSLQGSRQLVKIYLILHLNWIPQNMKLINLDFILFCECFSFASTWSILGLKNLN